VAPRAADVARLLKLRDFLTASLAHAGCRSPDGLRQSGFLTWPVRRGGDLEWAAALAAQMCQVCDRLPTQVVDAALSEAVSDLSWLDFFNGLNGRLFIEY
jgi:hypothetical protein